MVQAGYIMRKLLEGEPGDPAVQETEPRGAAPATGAPAWVTEGVKGGTVLNQFGDKIMEELNKLPLPMWAIILIAIVAGLLLLCCCGCICVKCCCKKKKKKEGKKGLKGAVDLKSVQMLGAAYKEKVQPDVEDLDNGADEDGDTDSVKSEIKLGKLQFSLDYDFQEGKVRV